MCGSSLVDAKSGQSQRLISGKFIGDVEMVEYAYVGSCSLGQIVGIMEFMEFYGSSTSMPP
jgi:hypothetical protein